jgi:hypothetical protein
VFIINNNCIPTPIFFIEDIPLLLVMSTVAIYAVNCHSLLFENKQMKCYKKYGVSHDFENSQEFQFLVPESRRSISVGKLETLFLMSRLSHSSILKIETSFLRNVGISNNYTVLLPRSPRTSQHFMEPESPLPCSQEPSTGLYP